MTIERDVDGDCWRCPFAEKHDWASADWSGTDITDCMLGAPDASEVPGHEVQRALNSRCGEPPSWCKLRASDVVVKLRLKPRG